MKENLTQSYLKECLTYNPDTGVFTWNTRPLSHFKNAHICNNWNSRLSNTKTGHNGSHGYLSVSIDSKKYLCHRLAFLYIEGYMPENQVDHMDRNRQNNKWVNLREVSRSCNMQNCNTRSDNTSGVCGVIWDKKSQKWTVRMKAERKNLYLGRFEKFEDAVMARYKAELNNPNWVCSTESNAYKYLKEHSLI